MRILLNLQVGLVRAQAPGRQGKALMSRYSKVIKTMAATA